MPTATLSPKKKGEKKSAHKPTDKTTRLPEHRFHDEDFEQVPELPLEIASDFLGTALRQGEVVIFLNCDEWATFLAGVRSRKIK